MINEVLKLSIAIVLISLVSSCDDNRVTQAPRETKTSILTTPPNTPVQKHKKALGDINFPDVNLAKCVLRQGALFVDELKTLNCSFLKIADSTGIEELVFLTQLNLAFNQLKAIDLSNNAALAIVSLRQNLITSISISENLALSSLDLGENQLTAIDTSNNLALTYLVLSNNPLGHADVSQNIALLTLKLTRSQLKHLDISKNTRLINIRLDDNALKSLDISANPALINLDLRSNRDLQCEDMHALLSQFPKVLFHDSCPS